MQLIDFAALLIMAIYYISEFILILSKKPKMNMKTKNGRVTLVFVLILFCGVAVSIPFSYFLNFYGFASIKIDHNILMMTSIILTSAGLAFRWASIIILGKRFNFNLAIEKDQGLHKSGLYKFIRHPSYFGTILLFIGMGFYFVNWLTLIIITSSVIFAHCYRIKYEEKLLISHFGREYIDYKKTTKKLIPFIY